MGGEICPPGRPGWNLPAGSDVVQRQFVFLSLVLANGTAPVHVPSTGPGLSFVHALFQRQRQQPRLHGAGSELMQP
jgi:hypothetical protein